MGRPGLSQIAEWIADGQMSLGMAAVTYGLSPEEKKFLAEKIRSSMERDRVDKSALLRDMKENPSFYHQERLSTLFDGTAEGEEESGDTIYHRYVRDGGTITVEELKESSGLPSYMTRDILCREDYMLPEFSVEEYSDEVLDGHRTDVFFLGPAACGKSSLTCSVIRQLSDRHSARFEPYRRDGADPTGTYYDAAMEMTGHFHKPAAPSSGDSILFCGMNIPGTRKRLTLVDGGRRSLADISKLLDARGQETAEGGIYRLMSGANAKMLFFLMDFGMVRGGNSRTILRHAMTLERTLGALSADRQFRGGRRPTISKVKTMGFIFTKCDLAGISSREALQTQMHDFLDSNFRNVLRQMEDLSQRWGINGENEGRPYIMPFSLGRFTVGNTLLYEPSCPEALADFIVERTPNQSIWHL